MTVQRRAVSLLALIVLLAGELLPASAHAARATSVSVTDVALMATVIVVPPTQIVDPVTGTKDSQKDIMLAMLNGYGLAQTGNNPADATYVNYPQVVPLLDQIVPGPYDVGVDQSRSIGATNLATAIAATHGPVTVLSYSQGASVAARLLDWQKQGLVTLPDPSMLTFVNIGDPNRPNGGGAERFSGLYLPGFDWTFDGATPSDTPYKVIEVTHYYDGFGDVPEYVLNPFADANALMGMVLVHPFYDQVNLNDPANTVTHYGNTTDILVPTSILPIMQPFYVTAHMLGITDTRVLDAVSLPLTVIIESAYNRKTAAPTPANWGNPLQNLDMTALQQSLVQAQQVLRTGKSALSGTTFPTAPELASDVWKATTTSSNLTDFMQSMTLVSEKLLYGTPKPATSSQPKPVASAASKPVTSTPPKLVSSVPKESVPSKPQVQHPVPTTAVASSKPSKPSKAASPAPQSKHEPKAPSAPSKPVPARHK